MNSFLCVPDTLIRHELFIETRAIMPSELWKEIKRRFFIEAKGLSEIHPNHTKYELTRKHNKLINYYILVRTIVEFRLLLRLFCLHRRKFVPRVRPCGLLSNLCRERL